MRRYIRRVNKSVAEDKLQEARSKSHESRIRYLRRMQETQESDDYLKESLARLNQDENK